MEKFKTYLLLVMAIVIMFLLLLRGCERPTSYSSPVYLKGKETVKWDTIRRPYKVTEISKQYYPKWDTAYTDTSKSDIPFERDYLTREYNDSITDTNLTIFRHSKIIGIIKEQSIAYRLKTPLEIKKEVSRTDTLRTVNTPKWSLYGGLETGGNFNQFNVSPYVTLNIRKASISYRYGLIDKTHSIGIGIRLFKSKE